MTYSQNELAAARFLERAVGNYVCIGDRVCWHNVPCTITRLFEHTERLGIYGVTPDKVKPWMNHAFDPRSGCYCVFRDEFKLLSVGPNDPEVP